LLTPGCAQFNEAIEARGISASFCVQKCPHCVAGAQSLCTPNPPSSTSKSHATINVTLWGLIGAAALGAVILLFAVGVRYFHGAKNALPKRRFRALDNPAFAGVNDEDGRDNDSEIVDTSDVGVYEDQEV
jgi:hypothetical protein